MSSPSPSPLVEQVEAASAPPHLSFHATIQAGEAVYHAALCSFHPNALCMVLNKGDRLDVYSLDDRQQLSFVASVPVPGWAVAMAVHTVSTEAASLTGCYTLTDQIVVLTRRNHLLCFASSPSSGLEIVGRADLSEATLRPPKRPFLVLHDGVAMCHVSQGMLKMVDLRALSDTNRRHSKTMEGVRIDELAIADMAVVGNRLAVLCKRASQQTVVKHYVMPRFSSNQPTKSRSVARDASVEEVAIEPSAQAYRLQRVGDDAYLILAVDSILCHDLGKGTKAGRSVGSVVLEAICPIDGDEDAAGSTHRFVAVDSDGMLYNILVDAQSAVNVDRLGRLCRASCLCYLGRGVLFVGSDTGDSHTVQLLTERNSKGIYFDIVSQHRSMGPIVDAALTDLDSTGRHSLVACSGSHMNGGLAVLRKGVGMNVQQETDFPLDITSIDYFVHRGRRYMTVKLVEESYVFALTADNELEEESSERFIPSGEAILLTKNVHGGALVVVTSRRVGVYRDGERKGAVFGAPPCILATVSGDMVACVMQSLCNQVHIFKCAGGAGQDLGVSPAGSLKDLQAEISAIDIRKGPSDRTLLAVAFWSSNVVQLFGLTAGASEKVSSVECKALRSTISSMLILPAGDADWYLFLGCLDGTVGYFRTGAGTDFRLLSTSCSRPVRLFKHTKESIFCSGDHPCFIVVDKSGLVDVLPVDVNDISAFTKLRDPADRLVAIGVGKRLGICLVDPVDKTRRHLTTVRFRDLGLPSFGSQLHNTLRHEHPIAIAVGSRTVAVCTNDSLPNQVQSKVYERQGRLLLLNKRTLQYCDKAEFEAGEYPVSCLFAKLEGCAEQLLLVGSMAGKSRSRFECSEGRILVFSVSESGKLQLQCDHSVDGAVVVMRALQGRLAIGVQGKVLLFKYKATPKPSLAPQCEFYGQIFVEALDCKDDLMAIGDNIKSVVVARMRAKEKEVVEVSRNIDAHSISAVHIVDERRFLAADTRGNLLAMAQVQSAMYNDARFQTLECTAAVFTGSPITRLLPGSISNASPALEAILASPVLYTSQSGAVALVAQLKDRQLYEVLLKVQGRLELADEAEATTFLGHLGGQSLDNKVVQGDILFRMFKLDDPMSVLHGLDLPSHHLFSVIESLFNSV